MVYREQISIFVYVYCMYVSLYCRWIASGCACTSVCVCVCVCVCVAGGGGLTSSFLSSALSIVLSLVGAATSIFDNVFVHFC